MITVEFYDQGSEEAVYTHDTELTYNEDNKAVVRQSIISGNTNIVDQPDFWSFYELVDSDL